LNSAHRDRWHPEKTEANLIKLEDDPTFAIHHGPAPVVTTQEQTADASDDDEMIFTGASFAPVGPDEIEDADSFARQVNCCYPTTPYILAGGAIVFEDEDADADVEDVTPVCIDMRENDEAVDSDIDTAP
jgi:hypothetical protein